MGRQQLVAIALDKMFDGDPRSVVTFDNYYKDDEENLWTGWFWKLVNGNSCHFAVNACCNVVTFKAFNKPANWKHQTILSYERIIDDKIAKNLFGWKPKNDVWFCSYFMVKLVIKDWDDPCYLFISNTHNGYYSCIVELRTPEHYEFGFI